jgi:hypothetical protein
MVLFQSIDVGSIPTGRTSPRFLTATPNKICFISKEPVHPKGQARLPKRLRGFVEVEVEQSAWVRIPYLAFSSERSCEDVRQCSRTGLRHHRSAKMSERLRSATQVRVAQASWVRFPLFASRPVFASYK